VTAGPQQDAAAATAMAAGETAARKHDADALAQHAISGSATAVEAASTPDDHAVTWPSSSPSPQRP
jgi:predicted regulator of Ras-like GTPase activity (Roadblock/LC7/MglB family)